MDYGKGIAEIPRYGATMGGRAPMVAPLPLLAPGVSRATLPLSEGIAALEFPDRLSPESLEDLKDWMEGMLRRAERVAKRTQQQASDDGPGQSDAAYSFKHKVSD